MSYEHGFGMLQKTHLGAAATNGQSTAPAPDFAANGTTTKRVNA